MLGSKATLCKCAAALAAISMSWVSPAQGHAINGSYEVVRGCYVAVSYGFTVLRRADSSARSLDRFAREANHLREHLYSAGANLGWSQSQVDADLDRFGRRYYDTVTPRENDTVLQACISERIAFVE